jgi:hypothetical protein
MEKDLSQLLMRMEILNLKLDSVLDNIVVLKDYQKLSENRLNNLEKIMSNIQDDKNKLKEELKDIKISTDRMDDHIAFVENVMYNITKLTSLRNLNPLTVVSNLNPFKSIQDADKQYLERQMKEEK